MTCIQPFCRGRSKKGSGWQTNTSPTIVYLNIGGGSGSHVNQRRRQHGTSNTYVCTPRNITHAPIAERGVILARELAGVSEKKREEISRRGHPQNTSRWSRPQTSLFEVFEATQPTPRGNGRYQGERKRQEGQVFFSVHCGRRAGSAFII